MRKLLLITFMLIILTGCSNKKFNLEEEHYNNNDRLDINSKEYKDLINDKKSFTLFVYTPGCISCIETEKVLREFQDENNIFIYTIEASQMKETKLSKHIKYTPSVILINKGKVISYLDASSDEDKPYYETLDGFKEWFSKYIILK